MSVEVSKKRRCKRCAGRVKNSSYLVFSKFRVYSINSDNSETILEVRRISEIMSLPIIWKKNLKIYFRAIKRGSSAARSRKASKPKNSPRVTRDNGLFESDSIWLERIRIRQYRTITRITRKYRVAKKQTTRAEEARKRMQLGMYHENICIDRKISLSRLGRRTLPYGTGTI